jgi:hypothetical protein
VTEYTTNFNLPKPLPNENMSRAAHNDLVQSIDTNIGNALASQSTALTQVETDFTSHKADYTLQIPYAAATGSANTYTVTLNPAASAYVDGMGVAFKVNVQNTGASTINVNGLGAKAIKKANGNDVSSENLKAGSIYSLRYNATAGNFILQGEGGEYGTGTGAQLLQGYTIGTETGVQPGQIPITNPEVNDQISAWTFSVGQYSGDGQNYIYLGVPTGTYLNGVNYAKQPAPNHIASNIKAGVADLGVTGTLQPYHDPFDIVTIWNGANPMPHCKSPDGYFWATTYNTSTTTYTLYKYDYNRNLLQSMTMPEAYLSAFSVGSNYILAGQSQTVYFKIYDRNLNYIRQFRPDAGAGSLSFGSINDSSVMYGYYDYAYYGHMADINFNLIGSNLPAAMGASSMGYSLGHVLLTTGGGGYGNIRIYSNNGTEVTAPLFF